MSTIILNHLRQECLEHPKVRDEIDFDDAANFLFGVLEEVVLRHNSSVVHENRDISNLGEYFAAGFQNLVTIRDVDSEKEKFVSTTVISELYTRAG